MASSAVSLRAQDLFVLPGAGATNGTSQAYVTNPLSDFRTFTTGVGTFELLPNVNASTFFAVASSTTNTIMATDDTFLSPVLVASLPNPAKQAIITPNGSVLAVAATSVYLFDTATNAELISGGFSQGNGISTVAVAASLDSASIFALGTNGGATSLLTAISTTTYAATGTLPISATATAVTVGPNGLVYVSMPNEILEVNPRTLQPTFNGAISLSGTPGPLVFTADGQYAVGANQSTFGNSLLIAALAPHTATDPALGLPALTSLQAIGLDTVLALSGQGAYQITISTPIAVTAVPGVPQGGLVSLAVSNDVPAGTHSKVQAAFLVSANTLYQFSPSSQNVAAQYSVASNVTPGALTYAVPALTTAQSQPASLLSYGTSQTILPSATSEPLVVQVLNPNNLPISGVTVQFQSSTASATLSSTSATTGGSGYALTYLTASGTAGTVTVTATVGSLTATFTIDVSATAQGGGGSTLTIVAGQGQLLPVDTSTAAGSGFGSALEVLATAANGSPIAGLPVTFSVPSTEGTLEVSGVAGAASQVVNTNSAGVASVNFLTTSLPENDTQGFLQTLVTASAANTNSVTFYITAINPSPSPSIYPLAPVPGTTLTGAEGVTLPAAVEAQVISSAGVGIPNVSLFLTGNNTNSSLYPTIACDAAGGFVLTNSAGIASCDATFGPRIGSGSFTATVGYSTILGPTQFKVTPGAPATVQITQGNNQTGNPGQTLPLALLVHVTDSGGNIVKGAAVAWSVLTAGAVTLTNVVSITDSNGNASALATLGAIGGAAQVQATAGTVSATFNLTVNIPSAGIQKVSGDQQTATVSTAFGSPLTVEVVDSSGSGIPGAQVNFQVIAGAATLGSSSVITSSAGLASTTVTAGATPGSITVTATSSTFSVSFTLTAQPVGPSNITIINGASFNPNTGISPGGIATISGTGILNGVTGVVSAAKSSGQLPTTFSGVTITFNAVPAPIYYVEAANGVDQVTVQVPFEVQPGSAVALTVAVTNAVPATVMIPVKALAPGVFTSSYGGKNYAVAVRPDGSQVSPTNPAQRGENIQLYITGLGQTNPSIGTGIAGVADQEIISTLIVGLNNGGVPLISAVYGPGLIGVYVVTLQVPADTQTGPYQPVGIIAYDSQNNANFAQATYIPIE
jgi:uncharacterized protein (TIGR03437 family)